jgi:leucyl-tRNA synthetase
MNKGTGVVTSVPSDSPDDFAMLRDLQTKKGMREKYNVEEEWCVPFEPIPIIDVPELGDMCAPTLCEKLKVQSHKDEAKLKEAKTQAYNEGFYKGVMKVGPYAGQPVEQAKPLMKQYLVEQNQAIVYHEPEGEVVSRSGDDCVVALKFQWMLNYGEESWKQDVKAHIDSDNFKAYNPKTQEEFNKILNWLKEWGCSRTAGLGTKLPWDDTFLVESLSDSTIYMSYYTVCHLLQGGVIDGSKVGPLGIKPEELTTAAFDYVFLGKDYNAEECSIPEEKLKMMRHEFEFWYPMDLRVSGKDLIRNHLTMSLYNHAAIWHENQVNRMTRSYFCNGYLNLNNTKMSKSTGNFMTLRQCIDKYGCDATRFALADAGDLLDDANFDDKVANAAILKLFTLEEWIQKYTPKGGVDFSAEEELHKFSWDRIVQNELNRIIKLVDAAYSELKVKNVIKYAFAELSNLKEAYRIASAGNPNPKVMFHLLECILVLMNPITPLYC